MELDRATPYFKKWYDTHKDELSEKRKVKYHSDPRFREAILSRQKAYRSSNRRESTKGSPKFRLINGVEHQVFRIQAAADIAGCSVEFIRKYEKIGTIPEAVIDSPQRYYTKNQVLLIRQFSRLMLELKYEKDVAVKKAALDKYHHLLHSQW